MGVYQAPAVERAMKVQEVILRAMSGEFAWVQATEILGLSARSMRRWRARYEEHGYDGLYDRPPAGREPHPTQVERVLGQLGIRRIVAYSPPRRSAARSASIERSRAAGRRNCGSAV